MTKKIIVITDNYGLYKRFQELLSSIPLKNALFTFYCSPNNSGLFNHEILECNVKNEVNGKLNNADLIISLHCQQVFPLELISNIKCINVHPGLNPHNRGWYPHVFSVFNEKPAGATIHEISPIIDHGPTIASKQIKIFETDTSETLYKRINDAEIVLLKENIISIIENTYKAIPNNIKGNYNSKNDFKNICEINMEEQGTFRDFYNKLRALSFSGYNNAWYLTKDGKKCFINLEIKVEDI